MPTYQEQLQNDKKYELACDKLILKLREKGFSYKDLLSLSEFILSDNGWLLNTIRDTKK